MTMPSTTTPILFVFFRRAELALRAFEPIRAARPARLYLAADGARPDRPGEAEVCRQTRMAIEARIDWPCVVARDYLNVNEGAARRVSHAINQVFEHEERLVIIEDDCVAHPTFFRFCDELLERYADEDRIAMVSGNQFVPGGWRANDASYRFVRLAQVWGWATWRRAWRRYDDVLKTWPEQKRAKLLERVFLRPRDRRYWTKRFDHIREHDVWDYKWCYTRWLHGQVGIVPNRNLVTNLGFSTDASHTQQPNHPAAALPAEPMEFPLRHPAVVELDDALDERTAEILFSEGGWPAWWKYQREQRLARWCPALFGR